MHVPAHFALSPDRIAEVLSTVRAGNLITHHEEGLHATLVPFYLREEADGSRVLVTHLVRNNPQARTPVVGDGLVILDVADAYVSSLWYPSRETDPDVPTWDYITIHARGPVHLDPSPGKALEVARELTRRMHPDQDALEPIAEESLVAQSRAIVAVEIPVTSVEGKAKMSQNRSPEDVGSVIRGLEGDPRNADLVTYLREVSLPHAQERYALLDRLRAGRETR